MTQINPLSEHSRRRFMQGVAATGALAAVGHVGAQLDQTTIVLDGLTAGWEGVEPAPLEGQVNPTMELEDGQTYEVTWENVDGQPHNFVILSETGEQLERSEIIEEQGATQTVTFEATAEMAEYYCEIHPDTMRGEISVGGNGDEAAGAPLEGVQVAGDFDEGATVGLQRVAEGLPGLTALEPADTGDGMRHFVATQTGQIYAYDPAAGAMAAEPAGADDTAGATNETAADNATDADTDSGLNTSVDNETNGTASTNESGVDNETGEMNVSVPTNDTVMGNETDPANATGETNGTASSNDTGVDGTGDAANGEDGTVLTRDQMTLILDIADRIVDLGLEDLGGYDERGLLGLAFHPDVAENGRFFVRYSAPSREGTPDDFDHTDVLAEFSMADDGTADPESEEIILETPQPQNNHNGGRLAFGPDGYLYTSIGDGGNVHDIGLGHVEDWYQDNEGGNGQDTEENRLGGVHRIDVDAEGEPYAVPDDNPLVGEGDHLPEHWAWGFRNPWGMSFGDDGRLFVTDAGQHLIESVYVVERGGNYSWNVREGSFCFSPENPLEPPESCPIETPEDVRGGEPLRNPVAEFAHMRATEAFIDSSVIVQGNTYEGDAVPELEGAFVFGNWSNEGVVAADGEVLTIREPSDGAAEPTDSGESNSSEANCSHDAETAPSNETENATEMPDGDTAMEQPEGVGPSPEPWTLAALQFQNAENEELNRYVYGVERGADGELYVLTNTDYRPDPPTGEIYKIVPADEGEEVPAPADPQTVDPEQQGE